jgi:amidase
MRQMSPEPAVPPDSLGAFLRDNHVTSDPTGLGTLDGLTFAVKDVFDVEGSRTGFGQPSWLATHEPARGTAPSVACLLAAGARLLGRTVCDELTYSLTGENIHYGTPLNPASPARVPGGSSSGSASAVAGGMRDFALGTDCAGSVRIPSSYCGIFGMRPTHGRVSLELVCPFSPSFDTVGWMASECDVLARVGRVLLGEAGHGTGSREIRQVLIGRDTFDLASPQVAQALQASVAKTVEVVGASEELVVSEQGLERWMECFRTIQGFEIWSSLGAWVKEARPDLGPGIRERIDAAALIKQDDVDDARRFRAGVVSRLKQILSDDAVLCLPTAPGIAPLKNAAFDDVEVSFRARAISLLCIAGLGGLPQLTVPAATVDGCPVGLSLVGSPGADLALIELAAELPTRPIQIQPGHS